ncbi:hypothetical protein NPIL_352091 [Nephila pilipes]|uniref:Uncharacterized protein n=1 Tax=Nephila pilipes TaxID=299642 RepID=A0A8X6TWT4_NEPPI|nr:hypothetical protein NPIL_352091 [Nephila pilipes]
MIQSFSTFQPKMIRNWEFGEDGKMGIGIHLADGIREEAVTTHLFGRAVLISDLDHKGKNRMRRRVPVRRTIHYNSGKATESGQYRKCSAGGEDTKNSGNGS